MFDIHCHILPGIDDGSGNMRDSIEMAQLAAETGTKAIVATPHCNVPNMFDNYWCRAFAERIFELQSELDKHNIPISIYSGQEIFLSSSFESHIKNNEFITLNNSRYMLVEFDFYTTEASALSKLEQLVSLGYVPVVAHPERYGFVSENPAAASEIHSAGGLLQVNGESLLGHFGRSISKTADMIIRSELADFVASDAHSQYSRTPDLSQANEYICTRYSYDYADILFRINPLKVIDDKPI